MIFYITILISHFAFATSLNDAISQAYNNKPSEILKEEKTKDSTISQAIQSVDPYLPNASLYYNYTQPGAPTFSKPLNTTNSAIPQRFITGLTQTQYGIGVDYNIIAISQLVKKISAIGASKNVANFQMMSAKSSYIYNLVDAYISLYRAKETLLLQEKILQTAEKRASELQNLFQYGKISKSDMLSAQSDFLKSKMDVKNYQNILQNAKNKYIDLFHFNPPNDMLLPYTKLSDVAKNLKDLKMQIHQNYDISAMKNNVKTLKIESQIANLTLLPKITIGYKHNFTNPDKNINIPNYRQNIFSVNANLDLLDIRNYFSGKQLNNDSQKKAMESEILLQKYLTEAEDLWNTIQYYEEMEQTMTKIVQNTEESHRITRNEVAYGLKTFTEELLAKQNYYNAKLNLLETQLQKTAKIYRLKFLTNKLIEE